MKDRKLLIPVRYSTRKFYLYRPKRSRDWHFQFFSPVAVDGTKGKRINRSTGTTEVATARKIATLAIESFWTDGGRGADVLKLRSGMAPLAEIFKAYEAGARTITDKEELAQTTINGNMGALALILETRFNEGRRTRSQGAAEKMTASALTAAALENFKRGWLASTDHANPQAMASARQTANAYLRQARSIFAAEYMPLYADLQLPDLTEFRAVKQFKIKADSTRYVPIPQSTIDAMEADVRGLRETRPEVYLAFYMMLWLGMRSKEVRLARLEWLEQWPTGAKMAIQRRAYFKPKGIDGVIAVAPQLRDDIAKLSPASRGLDFILPSPNETARHDVLRRELSGIVRRHLGNDRRKTCHELRKHAISMVLMRTRSYVDTLKFSRHADMRTLQNHYGSFLDELPPITSSNWRDEPVQFAVVA